MSRAQKAGGSGRGAPARPPRFAVLSVSVRPRAGVEAVGPFRDSVLKVSVKAAPERGAANEAVIAALARAFRMPRSGFSILRGASGRKKEIRVEGVDGAALARLLASFSV